mmetsp:Transcript_8176/g.14149  ORF Transcript_8176/g.14149 Transcript_8176/m.14149 type:complete len:420 (-) Transcript_8176:74-1333(-)
MSYVTVPLLEQQPAQRREETVTIGEVRQGQSPHEHLHKKNTSACDSRGVYDHGQLRKSSRLLKKRKPLFRKNLTAQELPLLEDVVQLPQPAEDDELLEFVNGIVLVAVSTTFFSLAAVFVPLNSSIPSVETGFIRSIYSLVFGSLLAHFICECQSIWPFQAGSTVTVFLFLRGLTDFASSNIFYFGCTQLGLGLATVILFTYPFWSAILAKVWLGEPFGLADFASTLVAFSGVALSAWPSISDTSSGKTVSPLMVLFVLLASIFQAFTFCLIKRLAGKVHFMQMTVSYGLSGILIGPGVMTYGVIAHQSLAEPAPLRTLGSPKAFLLSLLVAMCAMLAQVLLNLGCLRIPLSLAAAIRTLDIPLALVLQYIILGKPATLLEVLGASIVLVACIARIVMKQLMANRKDDALRDSIPSNKT